MVRLGCLDMAIIDQDIVDLSSRREEAAAAKKQPLQTTQAKQQLASLAKSAKQILFISGVTLTIVLKSTIQFFMKRQNFKGTISFGAGFLFVVTGWPLFGMILEAYGFIVLFSGFWPTLAIFMQKIHVIGWIIQQPVIRSGSSKKQSASWKLQAKVNEMTVEKASNCAPLVDTKPKDTSLNGNVEPTDPVIPDSSSISAFMA